ncbi:hypothetical protein [Virgibacillus ainsalahensis]
MFCKIWAMFASTRLKLHEIRLMLTGLRSKLCKIRVMLAFMKAMLREIQSIFTGLSGGQRDRFIVPFV